MRALLTGHSRGLGAALADRLLARNIPVLALSRRRNAELAARFPTLLREVELDLGDSAALAAWLAGTELAAFAAGATQLLLLNNAGTLQPMAPAGRQGPAAIAAALALNVAAPLMLADAVLALPAADRRVLHVSSGAARTAYAGWSIYGAGKAALDHHARCVAVDALPGVRVASVAPGVVDTEMQAQIRASAAADFPLRDRFAALKADGLLLSPDDCARRLVGYLLSDAFGSDPAPDLRNIVG